MNVTVRRVNELSWPVGPATREGHRAAGLKGPKNRWSGIPIRLVLCERIHKAVKWYFHSWPPPGRPSDASRTAIADLHRRALHDDGHLPLASGVRQHAGEPVLVLLHVHVIDLSTLGVGLTGRLGVGSGALAEDDDRGHVSSLVARRQPGSILERLPPRQRRRSTFGNAFHTGTPQKWVPSVHLGEMSRLRITQGGPRWRPSSGCNSPTCAISSIDAR